MTLWKLIGNMMMMTLWKAQGDAKVCGVGHVVGL
jgi:hypothetical protein